MKIWRNLTIPMLGQVTFYFLLTAALYTMFSLRRRQLNFVKAVERIISGRSVGKIIIILIFSFDTSKNKNIDHRVKETLPILST